MFDLSKKSLVLGAALAAPVIGLALPTESAVAATTPAPNNHCVTNELTADQMAAGTKSVVTCFATSAEAMASIGVAGSAASNSLLAVSYQDVDGGGLSLAVYGSDCAGGGLALTAPYDNIFSSTRNYLCSQVKHFDNSDYTGASQNVTGTWGQLTNLNSTMNDKTSSMKFYGPTN